uniref:Claspin n=1 Tax=Aceria tosichella TaxID=561515 RepID=A0A6G1SNC9_9ACAR
MEKKEKPEKFKINEFIDDEAELSGDDVVSDDEPDLSDDDCIDPELIDLDAKDLSSEEEEDVRRLYQKQLETEDRRAVLLLQEQLEDNDIGIGQRRRRKFRWQTTELMENSLQRHYDPDDEDSMAGEDDDDDLDIPLECVPRLKRPTAESILMGSTRMTSAFDSDDDSDPMSRSKVTKMDTLAEDSNSQTHLSIPSTSTGGDLNRFLVRDKELVQALSTREVLVSTREERDRLIQRELKRVAQSKSIFDQLY